VTGIERARRVLHAWHRVECVVAVAAFTFIAGIILLDVLGREVLGRLTLSLGIDIGPTGVFFSQRLSVLALVIGAYAGIGIATATGSHLRPRLGDGWVPKSWGPAMDRIADVATGIFLVGATWVGLRFVGVSIEKEERTMVLDWLVWPFQMFIALGFLSAGLRYFVFAAYPALRPAQAEGRE
jgi:TRAP-type C4-dicarboxylate transport system permease small subunit